MDKSKLAIFFRNGSKPVPRVTRMMKVAEDHGYKAIYCGAFRGDDSESEGKWEGYDFYRVGKKYPLLNGKGILTYLKFTFTYCRAIYKFFKLKKPDLLIASDFEVIIPALIYAKTRKVRLIYNIHDNLAHRYNIPPILASVLNLLEGLGVILSDSALVPEVFRKELLPFWCRKKIHIVKNTPGNIKYSEPRFPDDKIVLFYGGWLSFTRGLREMIDIAKNNDKIKLVIAGTGTDEVISYVKSHSFVDYLGYITHEKLLELTADAHFIPSFYDPSIMINKYAASNKLSESLAVGRPLLVNSEMMILNSFRGSDCFIESKYIDVADFGPKLIELVSNKEHYREMCKESRTVFEKQYSWKEAKEVMEDLINNKV
jgi:glycosyltransferase involved in cell wall biosynthesis